MVTAAFRDLLVWAPLVLVAMFALAVGLWSIRDRWAREPWLVHTTALTAAAVGLMNILSALRPALHGRLILLLAVVPASIRIEARLTSILSGLGLLVLAQNLWRRKRVAWAVTLVLLGISFLSHLLKGLDYEEALVTVVPIMLLIVLAPSFHAASDPPSVRQGLAAAISAFAAVLIYGTVGFYLLDRHFIQSFSLAAAFRETVVLFTRFYDPGLVPITRFGTFFARSINAVGAASLGYALVMLLRPVFIRRSATVSERWQAQKIVEAYGQTILARQALRDDKSYLFTPGGSVVSYVVRGRVALALGDPIGPPADLEAAVEQFAAQASAHDWEPAFYQTLPKTEARYQALGWQTLPIGQSALVPVEQFSLDGSDWKELRTALGRTDRAGYSLTVVEPPFSPNLLHELRAVSEAWLLSVPGGEKRFSLGWFEEAALIRQPVAIGRDQNGRAIAFVTLVPNGRSSEVAVDLMRRRSQIEHGTMEALFATIFCWAQEHGYRQVDLGLSPLAGVGQVPQDPLLERTVAVFYNHLNRFYHFKGLHAFKEKFHPNWSSRFLVYRSTVRLPAIGLALLRAHAES